MTDLDFIEYLRQQLALALGPIAGYLLEEEIQNFGGDLARLPRDRAAELVEVVSRQIYRPEKRLAFQQAMVRKLAEM